LALLLVLIFGLFMAVQTIHAHPIGHVDDLHCALCLVAHASVMVVALPVLPVLVESAVPVPPAEVQVPHILHSAPVFIRPPPAGL
jgi:hypothetical protein